MADDHDDDDPNDTDEMSLAWRVLTTCDAGQIGAHFRERYTSTIATIGKDPDATTLADIDAAASRLAALPDPRAAAFSGWLLLSIAKGAGEVR